MVLQGETIVCQTHCLAVTGSLRDALERIASTANLLALHGF
jgi:hypothetical protein